jgi:predicted unusual protein kinase regulating ubiquinone biosynthesis (AarF/ABC1/UbiB family)
MEWVDGARLNDKAAIDAMGLDSSKFVDTLVQCSLRQMLENGFFHADPHAGNLLAMPSGQCTAACLLKHIYHDYPTAHYPKSSQNLVRKSLNEFP